jgi:hypothetical protein
VNALVEERLRSYAAVLREFVSGNGAGPVPA